LLDVAKSIMAPLIRKWIASHKQVDLKVLLVYLISAIVDFGTSFFEKPVVVPTWTLI